MSQPKARGEQFAGVSRPIHIFGLGLDGQRWLFGERDLGEEGEPIAQKGTGAVEREGVARVGP